MSEHTELSLLKCCTQKEGYERFKKFVKGTLLTDDSKTLLEDIGAYYDSSKLGTLDWHDFETWYSAARSKTTAKNRYDISMGLIHKMQDPTFTPNVDAVLKHFTQLTYVQQVLDTCLAITSKGKGDLLDIDAILAKYMVEADVEDRRRAKYLAASYSEALEEVFRKGGIDWPVEALNLGVGPIAAGDFIIVAARPNAGKTSFVLQAVGKFMEQMEGDCLFVNNEERGAKIKARFVQTTLGKDRLGLSTMSGPDIEAAMLKKHGSISRFQVLEADYISVSDVERSIAERKPSIVVFNVLDKITGLETKEGETARLRRLYQWARTIASRGCIVFAIGQASEDAEGVEWIKQNQIYGSKTGAAGEADLIVTIGNTNDPSRSDKRFIHTPKNKLPGGKRSVPSMRHGFHVTEFDPETGCYKDV